MGFLDKLRGGSSVPADAAEFRVLWVCAERLPDPCAHDAASRVEEFVGTLSAEDLTAFRAEFREAYALLDSADYAQHLEPFPWKGADAPFSTRRFGLARERAILRGQAFFRQLLDEPQRMSIIETTPDLSPQQRVSGAVSVPLYDRITAAAPSTGQDEGELTELPGAARLGTTRGTLESFVHHDLGRPRYPWPGDNRKRWPGLPKKFMWTNDPERMGVALSFIAPGSDRDRLMNLPPSVARSADPEWYPYALGRVTGNHVEREQEELAEKLASLPLSVSDEDQERLREGDRGAGLQGASSPAIYLVTDAALAEATVRIWQALGKPTLFEGAGRIDRLSARLLLGVGSGWRIRIENPHEMEFQNPEPELTADAADIAGLPYSQIVDAFTAAGAQALLAWYAGDVPWDRLGDVQRSLEGLRDQYYEALPPSARTLHG